MGSCGSAKKTNINGAINEGKNNSGRRAELSNGLTKLETPMAKRKSIKLQDTDRISYATINDGILFILILDIKKFFRMDTSNQLASGSFGIIRKGKIITEH